MTAGGEVLGERLTGGLEHEVAGGNDSAANHKHFRIEDCSDLCTTLADPPAKFG